MTEIERILQKGQFDSEFLKPETLCDFYVDERRKKLWLVSLDLLSEIKRVCDKHGLRYFLFFGTLLGAIRHRGFIPWDDDIDIAMPREDYERFATLSHEFESPYFLQSPDTDNGYFYSLNKLRNSRTTALPLMFQYETFNQGICVDIFPIDDYRQDGLETRFEKVKELVMDLSTYMRMRNPELDEANRKRVACYSGRDPFDTLRMIKEICLADEGKACDLTGWISGNVYGPQRQSFKKGLFDTLSSVDFYGMEVPIPSNYDAVLKTLYGDYMALPPMDKRGVWHSGAIFDADKPYTDYLKHLSR
jgi:lipopolysaccharide cholinephosphotransferase